jgi:hypothetical protein
MMIITATTDTLLPTRPSLRLPFTGLDRPTQKLVDEYHDQCRELEADIADLHAGRQQLADAAPDTKVRDIIAAVDAQEAQRTHCERSLIRLHWRRFELLPELLHAAERSAADSKAQYEKSLADEIESMRSLGIDDAMPAANVNPVAADRQLRHHAMQKEWVLAAKGERDRAANELLSLKNQLGVAPARDTCRIDWQPLDVDPRIDALLRPVVRRAPLELSHKAKYITEATGLLDAALLDEHVGLLEEIANAIPGYKGYVVHVHRLPEQLRDAVRLLLEKLPRTREVQSLLTVTARPMELAV